MGDREHLVQKKEVAEHLVYHLSSDINLSSVFFCSSFCSENIFKDVYYHTNNSDALAVSKVWTQINGFYHITTGILGIKIMYSVNKFHTAWLSTPTDYSDQYLMRMYQSKLIAMRSHCCLLIEVNDADILV